MSDRWKSSAMALGLICSVMAMPLAADDGLLVFVSAFGKGDAGAIHALRVDTKSGQVKPVHRTTNVENPFFLALSPDRKFLYSIHADNFSDDVNDEIAAFRLEASIDRLGIF